MKVLIAICLALISIDLQAQSLSIFDIDTTNFPIMKAKFYAFDKDGNQITNISPSTFELTENGQPRSVLSVSCPKATPPNALSSVLTIDISGSMQIERLRIVKDAATLWVNALNLNKSECAVTSFDHENYLNQDFTTDRTKLLKAINSLKANGGTDYNEGLINQMAGSLLISKNGKHKKVIVYLTDGLPNREPNVTNIINEAKSQNCTIYSIVVRINCPQSLKDISLQTGGNWYEKIDTEEEINKIYQEIMQIAQGSESCEITWNSGISCTSGITNVELTLLQNGTKATTNYQSPNNSLAKLEFNPKTVKFPNPEIEVKSEQKVIATARNADFTVTNIKSNNAGFDINPKSFKLISGQSLELTVSYFPVDSGYNFCKFEIENNLCPSQFHASGGWEGIKPKLRTIKLIHPNGGEMFVVGSEKTITWEGVTPEEPIKIEYRIDDNQPWILIADSVTNLSYKWRVPNSPSNKCLARVTAAAKTSSYCDNPDVKICGKIWMGCNLDVDTYRNGDSIPEVTDPEQWKNLTSGAWCYFNNDLADGEIFGKLYNWYAVNDARGLAPDGWHIPTDAEWTELENCLGGSSVAGGKLKATGTFEGGDGLWLSPNAGATNEIGFSLLPGGCRSFDGLYYSKSRLGYWWTSTEYNSTNAWSRTFFFDYPSITGSNYNKASGFSVRCVRD